ncbi:MAG: cation:proton antiporter [Bdellovibrionales bacterium]
MLAELIIVLMGLLVAGFVGTRLAKVFSLPHSVFLVVIGVAAGAILRSLHPELVHQAETHFPDIILFVLLPPLIFESAYNFDLADLRKDLLPISFLAIGSLLLSTFIIGFAIHVLFGLQLFPSLTFGALISATDPVAVVALFKELGAPKRLNALIEGESLMNDGTAIVIYRVLVGLAATGTFQAQMLGPAISQFFIVAFGGALVGLITYGAVSLILRFVTDSAAQLGLTVAAAFLSFLVADHGFHVSGVISTMILGLLLGNKARLELNKNALHGMHYIWEFLALTANTIVFFAVGLSIDPVGLQGAMWLVLPTIGIVYFARAVGIYGTLPILNLTKLYQPISFGYQTIMVWGGLRGGLALALVLLLPEGFQHKQLFLSLASAVVLSTLFVNALTIERMMKWFGVNDLNPFEQKSYLKALKNLTQDALKSFTAAQSTGKFSSDVLNRQKTALTKLMEHRQQDDEGPRTDETFLATEAMRSALLHEQAYYNHNLEEGLISKSSYVCLTESVKERQLGFAHHGWMFVARYDFKSVVKMESRFRARFRKQGTTLSLKMETLLNLNFALDSVLEHVDHEKTKSTLSSWIGTIKSAIEAFYTIYPDQTASLQTRYLSSVVTNSADSAIAQMKEAQVISGTVAIRLIRDLDEIHANRMEDAARLQNPSLDFLIKRVPIFRESSDELVKRLSEKAVQRKFSAGARVVEEGADGESFFLVTAGVMEVRSEKLAAAGLEPRLFVGDFFGELSLLHGSPRNATVVASMPSEAIEIDRALFDEIMKDQPAIREKIISMAEQRAA